MRWCRIAPKNINRRADLVDSRAGNITANVIREFAGERRVVAEAIESRNHMRENRETSPVSGAKHA